MTLRERVGLWLAGVQTLELAPEPPVLKAAPAAVMDLGGVYGDTQGVSPPDDPAGLLKMHREWVYACVLRNAEGVAQTPLRLYVAKPSRNTRTIRRTRPVPKPKRMELETRVGLQPYLAKAVEVEEVVDPEHPFYKLWNDGNPHLTGSQLKLTLIMHMDLVGDSYCYIVMGEIGGQRVPQHLLILNPATVSKIKTRGHQIVAYVIRKTGSSETEDIPAEEIMHCKFPDPANPIWGKAPLEAVGYSARLYHDMNIYEDSLMRNSAMPSYLGSIDGPISEPDKRRLERRFNKNYRGPTNAGKFAVISGKLTLQQLGLSQRDMLMWKAREMTREDVCVVFDVPIVILLSSKYSLANVKTGVYLHQKDAIRPRCILVEDQINRNIIPLYNDPNLFVAFDNPVKEDEEFALKRRDSDLDRFVISVNQVREERGDEPVPWGDVPLAPQNVVPLGSAPGPVAQPAERGFRIAEVGGSRPSGASTKAAEDVPGLMAKLQRILQSVLGEQAGEVLANIAANPVASAGAAEGWLLVREAWPEMFMERSQETLAALLVAGGKQGADMAGVAMAFDVTNPPIAEAVRQHTFKLSKNLWGKLSDETQRRLRHQFDEALEAGESIRDITGRVQDVMGPEANKLRAERIARTETSRFVHEGQEVAWQQSGVIEAKRWLCSADACPFCLPLDGKIASLGEAYYDQGTTLNVTVEGGEGEEPKQRTMKLDYEEVGHPPLHPNCHCSLEPILIGEGG